MGFIKGIVNGLTRPELFFGLAVVALFLIIWKRELVASKAFGYGLLGILTVFFIFGTFDFNFRQIVTKPDNVPIVGVSVRTSCLFGDSIRAGALKDRRVA